MVPTYSRPGEPAPEYHEYDDDYLQTFDPRKDHGPAEYYTKPYIDKKEQELKGLIADEESARIDEDTAIRASVTAEESSRIDEDTAIRESVAEEVASRVAGDKAINDKIPSTASETNKLVDTAQMNEAINSMAAFYITKNAAGDAFASVAELTSATEYYCDGSLRIPTRNDYATVLSDEDHEDATTRYIYTGTRFQYQYTVNEAPFTQEQLDAINSGITSDNYVHKENPVAAGSLSINRVSNSTVGENSVAVGNNTIASGASSFAEGDTTVAEGTNSHAEGYTTTASGANSHAEGFLSSASNSYAHAEGNNTEASGESAHSEGTGTLASGPRAHAEGGNTKAVGYYAHAEGYDTESGRSDSIAPHAEGYGTHATNDYAHAEGKDTWATGRNSHAEGNSTEASGITAHTEGTLTKASGFCAHAEGNKTEANSDYMHAAGKYNATKSGLARVTGWGETYAAKDIEKLDTEGNFTVAGKVYSENDKLLIAAADQSLTAEQKAAARENIGIDNTLFTAAVTAAEQAQASAAEASQYAADARPAIEAADRAAASASAASTSETNADNSASEASASASSASSSASSASASATTASSSASSASTSATNAANSASAASASETNASSSASSASTSATNAASSASAASTSATNAANSASAAGKSATAADTSAKAAKTSETNAASSASAAATSASNAASAAANAIKTLSGSQTSTSSASQGDNVFTFTFPDGTKKTFTVKNGKDGTNGKIVTINGKSDTTVTLYGSDIAMSSSDTTKLNTAIGNKMDKANPTGTGSFSMNRKASTTVGTNSHAEGYDTTASGANSHAEGQQTTASNYSSHAEGAITTASGQYSHAEGYGSRATSSYTHAEGYSTVANANYSHTEGIGTVAESEAMHAAGKYNATKTGAARVTGWGTSSAKKDIEVLDTDGNMTLAGGLTTVGPLQGSNTLMKRLHIVAFGGQYQTTDDEVYATVYEALPLKLRLMVDEDIKITIPCIQNGPSNCFTAPASAASSTVYAASISANQVIFYLNKITYSGGSYFMEYTTVTFYKMGTSANKMSGDILLIPLLWYFS